MEVEHENVGLIYMRSMHDLLFEEERLIRERSWFCLQNIAQRPITSDQPVRFSLEPINKEYPHDQWKALSLLLKSPILHKWYRYCTTIPEYLCNMKDIFQSGNLNDRKFYKHIRLCNLLFCMVSSDVNLASFLACGFKAV